MAKVCYVPKSFSAAHLEVIRRADSICRQYAAQGFSLTLRQLYYQFVARGLLPNKDTEYKRLGSIINDARLAGLIDWSHMEDRTRNMRERSHWDAPGGVIDSAARSYGIELWQGQENYVEVWIEKDALVGVIEGVCRERDLPYFSCRGYTSQSEVWGASQRIIARCKGTAEDGGDRTAVILHLGDHDPSGKDMTRDITDRLAIFCEYHDFNPPDVDRLALNMDQVEQYAPPPNPAKITDSRASAYIAEFGDESWELDALDPTVIRATIEAAIVRYVDQDLFDERRARQEDERRILTAASRHWHRVADHLTTQGLVADAS